MQPKPFTFIAGDDDFLIQRRGEALFQTASQGLDAFAKETINGLAQNVGEAEAAINEFLEATQTLGLFGDKKAVWFKSVNFLGDSVTGRAEGTKAAVERLIQGLGTIDSENVYVIITAHPVDRRRKEYKILEGLGEIITIEAGKDDSQLATLLIAEAKALNASISMDTALQLVERVHAHTRMALEELKKLATFAGPGAAITLEMVEDLVPAFGEIDFFHAAEAFFELNLPAALIALKEHCFVHREVRPLLSALQNRCRLLIQLKTLLDCGDIRIGAQGITKESLQKAQTTYAFPEGEKSTLNVFSQNPWYLGKLARPLAKISLKRLVDWQLLCLQAFEELLKTPDEAPAVMERLYIRALS